MEGMTQGGKRVTVFCEGKMEVGKERKKGFTKVKRTFAGGIQASKTLEEGTKK